MTPEMLSYFSEELTRNASQGTQNIVANVAAREGRPVGELGGGRPAIRHRLHALARARLRRAVSAARPATRITSSAATRAPRSKPKKCGPSCARRRRRLAAVRQSSRSDRGTSRRAATSKAGTDRSRARRRSRLARLRFRLLKDSSRDSPLSLCALGPLLLARACVRPEGQSFEYASVRKTVAVALLVRGHAPSRCSPLGWSRRSDLHAGAFPPCPGGPAAAYTIALVYDIK